MSDAAMVAGNGIRPERASATTTRRSEFLVGTTSRGAEKARKRQTDLGARRRQLVVRQHLRSDDDRIVVARRRQEKGKRHASELPRVAATSRKMLLFAPKSGK
jgi:hypothetical protein